MNSALLTWEIGFQHDDHVHPLGLTRQGGSIVFNAPNSGHGYKGNTGLVFTLTGLSPSSQIQQSASITLYPKIVKQTVESVPSSSVVKIDGHTYTTPFTIDAAVGFVHDLDVPSCQ